MREFSDFFTKFDCTSHTKCDILPAQVLCLCCAHSSWLQRITITEKLSKHTHSVTSHHTASNMKLHLPKQLFTALLTAITLAATPAALTLGSAAWGESLGISRGGDLWAADYAFSFILNDDAFANGNTVVLGKYYGGAENNAQGANAIVAIKNGDSISLQIGQGGGTTGLDSFTFYNNGANSQTFTGLQTGVVYTLDVAGASGTMNPVLRTIAAGTETDLEGGYNGKMNGSANQITSVFNSSVGTLISASDEDGNVAESNILVWAGKADEGAISANWGTWNNISGTSNGATADATSDLIFDATSTVAKEVNITDSVTAGSIALYDDYTFNATGATSLTVTNGITIAQGKSLTLQGSAITLTGTFSINGTLNIGGTLALTSSDQLGTLGAPTVKSGGVLDLTGCDSCVTNDGSNGGVTDEFSTINDSSVKTEDGGYIRVAFNHTSSAELKLGASIALNKNIEAQGALVVHGNGNSHAITIGEGVSLKATSVTGDNGLRGLEAINKAIISITGGSVEASRIVLGHDSSAGDFWGKLEMTTGSLKSGAIHLRENHSNVVSITGGNVEFTEANVLVRVDANNPNKKTLITIGGTGTDSVTLKANQVAWTLDGTGLDTVPTIGNVTIDAGNAYGITLNKINLTGAIINNSSLTIGSATVAAGSTVSINGSGTTNLTGTITNNGSLTLNGSIELLGELKTNFAARSEAGESYVMADGKPSSVSGNGFLKLDGGSYWLTTGNGSITMSGITEGETTLKHGQDTYKLYIDNGDEGEGNTGNYYIGVESNIGTVFYVSADEATVDKDVFERATAYHLLGGKMQVDTGVTLNSSSISYTAGSIELKDGAALKLDSTSLTASSLLSDSSFLSTIRDEDEKTEIGKVIITQATTLNNEFKATFDGAVECDGVKLTAGTAPGNSVDLSSISNFILNNGAEIYYHANPTKDRDIQKITVEAGTGSLKLQDSDGAAFDVGSVEIASGATFKFWSNWHDSDLNIGAVSGAGKFRAESSDNSIQSGKVNIASLDGFTGSLEFEKDTQYALTVVIDTGSSAVDFASLKTINSNGSVDLTFNVQADTSVASLTAAGGTVEVSEGKTLSLGAGTAETQKSHSIGTLNAASGTVSIGEYASLELGGGTSSAQKEHSIGKLDAASGTVSIGGNATLTLGGGTADAPVTHSIGTLSGKVSLAENAVLTTITSASGVTLAGSGTYNLADGDKTMTDGVTLGTDWTGTVVAQSVSSGAGNLNNLSNMFSNLTNGTSSKVKLSGVQGWLCKNTTDRSILLENAGGTAALTLNDGSSGKDETHTTGFAGSVGGTGDIVYNWNKQTNAVQHHVFSGDTSAWSGKFINENCGSMSMLVEFTRAGDVFSSTVGGGGVLNKNTSATNGIMTVKFNSAGAIDFYGTVEKNAGATATGIEVAQNHVTLHKNVNVDSVTVAAGASAKVNATLTAADTVTNNGQIQLGKVVTTGETKETQITATISGGSMSKVKMDSAGISSTDATGSTKGTISNALVQLAQDATFTIQDMTLTNATITTASVSNVHFDNVTVAGQTVLKMQAAMNAGSAVGTGGSKLEFTTSSYSGLTLGADASLTVDLGDLSCLTPMEYGQRYDLTITLSGFSMGDYEGNYAGSALQFAADSWLGELLAQGNNANVQISISQMEEGAAAAGGGGGATGVSYSTGNVGTIITITGLNVPEPATSTLSLLALAGLCARRRRKM